MAVRLLHLSDVHVTVPRPGWRPRDLLGKSTVAWSNWHLLRRGRRFADAKPALQKFAREVAARQPDLIAFSGDATALGFGREAVQAAELLQVGMVSGIAIPGNHDHYTPAAVARRDFENAFAPWLAGERVDGHEYPFARRVNDVWFIAVNSAVPNRLLFDARGRVGHHQLDRLDQLLAQLSPGVRVLVTHYPYVTASGLPEPRWHGLRDRNDLAKIVARHDVRLWLCGHRHHGYRVEKTAGMPCELICAGSATMRGAAGFWDITIQGNDVQAERHHL